MSVTDEGAVQEAAHAQGDEEGQLEEAPVQYEEVPAMPGELSEAELLGLRDVAHKMLSRHKTLGGALQTLIQAYRLHNVAMLDMLRVLEEERADPRLTVFFTQAAKHKAKEPFKREQLAETLGQRTLPWLLDQIAQEKVRDNSEEVKAQRRQEEARRTAPIRWPVVDLPLPSLQQGDHAVLPRDRTLAIAGPAEEVYAQIERLARTAMGNLKIIYCHEQLGEYCEKLATPLDKENTVIPLGRAKWLNACDNERTMMMAFHDVFRQLEHVDLILVADMSDFNGAMTQQSPAGRAATGHRRLRRFAEAMGCGLVIGVPTTEENPYNLSLSAWSNLTTYTHLYLTDGAHGKP
jgi:hypothetical protein